jgi:lambda repressor-like predicted transcriptional regulator
MHPEEIKAALRIQGVTLTALADEVGVSRSMVTHVIHSHARSAHVMERIANILGKPVASIWSSKPTLRRAKQPAGSSAGAAA